MKHFAFGFLVIALLFAAMSWIRNPEFEFCTTRAYGLAFPWRIDYCICADDSGGKQERTEFPRLPWLVTSMLAGSVGVAFASYTRQSAAIRQRDKGSEL